MTTRTREQERAYRRAYRARTKDTMAAVEPPSGHVTAVQPLPVLLAGRTTVEAVAEALAALPGARQRPEDLAAALALAAVIDDPFAQPQRAGAVRELRRIFADLRGLTERPGSALARLRQRAALSD